MTKNQQGAPEALTDFERRHAIRQGHEIAASDGYFEARPQIDSNDRRKVFQAGFERGWDRHAAMVEAQQPAPSAAAAGNALPEGWVPLVITHEGQYPEEVAYGPQILMYRLGKWLRKYFDHVVASKAQPSPTPQADSAQDEPLQAFDSPRARALMRAWEEGWAACRDAEYVGEEAQNDAFNSSHTLTLCIAEDQQLPAPQADSQPAPQGETNAQLDIDSNSSAPGQQRDVAGSVALGQPVGNGSDATAGDPSAQGDKLLTVAERNIRSFLRSAVFKSESDREAALNCVDVLWEAARALADSVTAPAGGAVAYLDIGAGGYLDLGTDLSNEALSRLPKGRHSLVIAGTYGIDGYTPTPPAQAADSVLEDAARYRFLAEHCRSTSEHWGGRWSIIINGPAPKSHDSEDDFDEAVDAARKQGANHD